MSDTTVMRLQWWVSRQWRSVIGHSKLCYCSVWPTQEDAPLGGRGGREAEGGEGFWNGSAHLGSHCEEGLPFWWRLTWYLLQDHGNSLICSPRVFPLQQWDQQWLVSGQLDNSVLFAPVQGILQNRLYFMMMGLSTVTQHRLKTFPQDYGNEKRVTAQCGGLNVDSDEHGCPQQYLSSTNEDRISYRAHYHRPRYYTKNHVQCMASECSCLPGRWWWYASCCDDCKATLGTWSKSLSVLKIKLQTFLLLSSLADLWNFSQNVWKNRRWKKLMLVTFSQPFIHRLSYMAVDLVFCLEGKSLAARCC